jgi:hypothetical protein
VSSLCFDPGTRQKMTLNLNKILSQGQSNGNCFTLEDFTALDQLPTFDIPAVENVRD